MHLLVRLPSISAEMLAIAACTYVHRTERASICEPSLARACVAMCPKGATAQPDSSCDCAPGLFQVWYVKAIFIHVSRLAQSIEVTAYTSSGQQVEQFFGCGEVTKTSAPQGT